MTFASINSKLLLIYSKVVVKFRYWDVEYGMVVICMLISN